ncbi:hypothetical protein AMATHDRAFT_42905 [Amanita thiersii Skay4041]|uniref:Uncharacterized protein n=1 Tax=Amanita thiersii Skay4041 TaxID=703135 RepID=A0A2A9N991_9AGAR|nr:hypothetical protein AMATHDRAFT_42905 [Amanita thiersii Skay4041]
MKVPQSQQKMAIIVPKVYSNSYSYPAYQEYRRYNNNVLPTPITESRRKPAAAESSTSLVSPPLTPSHSSVPTLHDILDPTTREAGFDEKCLEGLSSDLLYTPLEAFAKSCWQTICPSSPTTKFNPHPSKSVPPIPITPTTTSSSAASSSSTRATCAPCEKKAKVYSCASGSGSDSTICLPLQHRRRRAGDLWGRECGESTCTEGSSSLSIYESVPSFWDDDDEDNENDIDNGEEEEACYYDEDTDDSSGYEEDGDNDEVSEVGGYEGTEEPLVSYHGDIIKGPVFERASLESGFPLRPNLLVGDWKTSFICLEPTMAPSHMSTVSIDLEQEPPSPPATYQQHQFQDERKTSHSPAHGSPGFLAALYAKIPIRPFRPTSTVCS